MFAVVRFHDEFQRSLDLQLVRTFLNAAVHQSLVSCCRWLVLFGTSVSNETWFASEWTSRDGDSSCLLDGFEISRIFFALFKLNYTFFYTPVDVFLNSIENNAIRILFTIANARTESLLYSFFEITDNNNNDIIYSRTTDERLKKEHVIHS